MINNGPGPIPPAVLRPEPDNANADAETPLVGAADAEADRARTGAEADLTFGARDGDGVPTGADDRDADIVASGGKRPFRLTSW